MSYNIICDIYFQYISVLSNIVLLLGLCSLYSIKIVHGAAVIGESCSVHPASGTHIIFCSVN